MARKPERIPKVIETLRKVWFQYPDLRLGQLLTNVVPHGKDLFYVEEDELVKLLNEFAAKDF